MKKFLIDYGYCIYLGASLGAFSDLQWNDWRVFVIILPTVFLVAMKDNLSDKQE